MVTYYAPSSALTVKWSSIPTFERVVYNPTSASPTHNFVYGSYKRYYPDAAGSGSLQPPWTPSLGSTIYSGSTASTLVQVNYYSLSVGVDGGVGGTVTGSVAEVRHGTTSYISATPSARWKFLKWKEDNNTSASRNITMTADTVMTAMFVRSEWSVTVQASGQLGSALVTFGGSSATQKWVTAGSSCTIAANAVNSGDNKGRGNFLNWSNNLGTAASQSYEPTADVTLTAFFATIKLTAASNSSSLGSAYVGATGNYSYQYFASGTSVQLRTVITNASTTTFISWMLGSTIVSYLPGPTIQTGSSNATYTAIFSTNEQLISVAADSASWGTAKIMDGATDRGTSYTAPHGTVLTLVAAAKDTATEVGMFLGWYNAANELLTQNETMQVTSAGFVPVTYTGKFAEAVLYGVTLLAGDGDPATTGAADLPFAAGCRIEVVDPEIEPGMYYGGPMQVVAISAAGWHLGSWSVIRTGSSLPPISISEDMEGFGAELNFFLDSNVTVEGVFVINTYAITAEIDGPSQGYGTVEVLHSDTEGGTYGAFPEGGAEYGTFAKLVATPESGISVFRGWFLNGVNVGTSAEMVVVVGGDAVYVAKFGGTVAVEAVGDAGGTALASVDGQTYAASVNWTYGDTVLIAASSGTVFFRKWYSNTETLAPIIEYGASASFMPTQIVALKALFAETEVPVYVKLTSVGTSAYGDLMLSGAGVTAITEADYQAGLIAFYAVGGTAVLDGKAGDRFYILAGARYVQALCTLLQPLVASFSKWTMKYNATRTTFGTEFDLSNEPDVSFIASAHCVLSASYDSGDPVKVTLRHTSASTQAMGVFSLSPPGNNPQTGAVTQGDFPPKSTVTALAIPANGHLFAGWHDTADASNAAISTAYEYAFTLSPGVSVNLFAKFIVDTAAVYVLEGGQNPKTMTWRSRRYVSSVPFNFACIRVDADSYPVLAFIRMASSPDASEAQWAATAITIESNRPRRLPKMRMEKHFEIELLSPFGIVEVVVSTSMIGLRA